MSLGNIATKVTPPAGAAGMGAGVIAEGRFFEFTLPNVLAVAGFIIYAAFHFQKMWIARIELERRNREEQREIEKAESEDKEDK